jgi:hypothetical protein
MTQRRSGINAIRGWLYWMARFLGDVNAVQRGPHAIEQRVERRLVGRLAGRFLGKLFR